VVVGTVVVVGSALVVVASIVVFVGDASDALPADGSMSMAMKPATASRLRVVVGDRCKMLISCRMRAVRSRRAPGGDGSERHAAVRNGGYGDQASRRYQGRPAMYAEGSER
jgi:hypothetical protein